jgi:hypothetical protein
VLSDRYDKELDEKPGVWLLQPTFPMRVPRRQHLGEAEYSTGVPEKGKETVKFLLTCPRFLFIQTETSKTGPFSLSLGQE